MLADTTTIEKVNNRVITEKVRNWQAKTGLPEGMTPKKAMQSIVSQAANRRQIALIKYASKKALDKLA